MKTILLISLLLLPVWGMKAQIKRPLPSNVKVTTTRREDFSPYNGLTPGYAYYKFAIRDSSGKSFNVIFNFEKYTKESVTVDYFNTYINAYAYFAFEMIPDRKQDESFSIRIIMSDGYAEKNSYKIEGYRFKWRAFSEINENDNEKSKLPILLIYKEKTDENMIEENVKTLFGESLLNPKDKQEIIKKMRSITDNFTLMTYERVQSD
jgi:hypothetical protein